MFHDTDFHVTINYNQTENENYVSNVPYSTLDRALVCARGMVETFDSLWGVNVADTASVRVWGLNENGEWESLFSSEHRFQTKPDPGSVR